MRKLGLTALAVLAGSLLAAAAANAASYNYLFPDNSIGFALKSQGGVVNPGVLVGFNPQPDPPGTPIPFIALDDATFPVITQYPPGPCAPSACGSFQFQMSFLGVGTPGLTDPPDPEFIGATPATADALPMDIDRTAFSFIADGHTFDVTLYVLGPGNVQDWVAFNPQPDPPGDGWAVSFDFGPFTGDPQVGFSVNEDNNPLSFQLTTPLPAALPLFAGGLGVLGALAARRKRQRKTAA